MPPPATHFALRSARLGAELGQKTSECDAALAERDRLVEDLGELPVLKQQMAAATARLGEIEAERDRLLEKDGKHAEGTSRGITGLRTELEAIKGALPKSSATARRRPRGRPGWSRA